MYDLTNFTLGDMTKCGSALRRIGAGAKSVEEVAERIVRYLYENLIDKQTGEKSCVLVRWICRIDNWCGFMRLLSNILFLTYENSDDKILFSDRNRNRPKPKACRVSVVKGKRRLCHAMPKMPI